MQKRRVGWKKEKKKNKKNKLNESFADGCQMSPWLQKRVIMWPVEKLERWWSFSIFS